MVVRGVLDALVAVVRGGGGAQKPPTTRDFSLPLSHDPPTHQHAAQRFVGNYIRSAKYTVLSFLPLVLLDQFRRLANVYFLVISIIQLSTDLSPTNKYSTVLPLTGVIIVSIIKEAYEDYGRHQADRKVNSMPVTLLRRSDEGAGAGGTPAASAAWRAAQCQDVRVADVVLVRDGDVVPADLLLLSCSKSCAYVDTASLDGETNLKMKGPVGCTGDMKDEAARLDTLRTSLTCDLPNPRLYSFSGLLTVAAPAACVSAAAALSGHGDGHVGVPVGNDQVLLRGQVLRNSNWAVGLVVYTGAETKVQLNAREPPRKRSRVEKQLDSLVALIFLLLAVLCTLTAVGFGLWTARLSAGPFYLPYLDTIVVDKAALYASAGLTWVTSLLLFNNLLPISLIVTLELAKFAQARAMDADAEMVQSTMVERIPGHPPELVTIPTRARTSNLNESLGQIQYIVTDKTGTLTQNLMTLRAVSVAGVQFGSTSTAEAAVKSAGLRAEDPALPSAQVPFDDDMAAVLTDAGSAAHAGAVDMALCLALCHTVQVGESVPGAAPAYQSASPDEGALVSAACGLGYELVRRSETAVTLALPDGQEKTWTVLAVNEFSSTRKRMSILMRSPEGQHVLYCKGADSAMVARLTAAETVRGDSTAQQPSQQGMSRADAERASDGRGPVHSVPSVALMHTQADGAVNVMAAAMAGGGGGADWQQHREVVVTPLSAASAGYGSVGGTVRRNSGFQSSPSNDDAGGATSSRAGDLEALHVLQRHLDGFASGGLRTLVLAKKELGTDAAAELLTVHRAAASRVLGREEALHEAAELMETSLELVGATGIEDKLQEDVAGTISALSAAGIRFVMCTGDKTETAINIGLSCALLSESSDLVVLKSKDMDTNVASLAAAKASLKDRGRWSPGSINTSLVLVIEGHALAEIFDAVRTEEPVEEGEVGGGGKRTGPWDTRPKRGVRRRVSSAWERTTHKVADAVTNALFPATNEITGAGGRGQGADGSNKSEEGEGAAGEGEAGEEGEEEQEEGALRAPPKPVAAPVFSRSGSALKRELLEFMQQCRSVICCRVSPLQKAEVVNLIQGGISPRPMVLAVGDGGNDVSMIQAADIGVGIAGVEGQAAVQASDYAIGAFRFLAPLLLVHGRDNYRRVTLAINYSIYKNVVLVLSLWAYSVQAGWSGTSLFESYVSSMWNLLFTSLPILSVAIADRDMDRWAALKYPLVYMPGQRNASFSASAVAGWMATALLHAIIVGSVVRLAFLDSAGTSPVGHGADLYTDGCAVHFALVVLVTAKLALQLHKWYWHTVLAFVASLALWLGFLRVYSGIYGWLPIQAVADIFGVADQLFSRPAFWLTFPIATAASVSLDVLGHMMYRHVFPDVTAIVQEWSCGHAPATPVPLDLLQAHAGMSAAIGRDSNASRADTSAKADVGGSTFVPVLGEPRPQTQRAERVSDMIAGDAVNGSALLGSVKGPGVSSMSYPATTGSSSYGGAASIVLTGRAGVKRASIVYANNATADQASAMNGTIVVRAGVTGAVFDSDVSGKAVLVASIIASSNQALVADLLSGLTRLLRDVRADIKRNEAKIQRRLALHQVEQGEGVLSPTSEDGPEPGFGLLDGVLPALSAWFKPLQQQDSGGESTASPARPASMLRAKDPSASMLRQSDPSNMELASLSPHVRTVEDEASFSPGTGQSRASLSTQSTPGSAQRPAGSAPIAPMLGARSRRLSARFRSFVGARMDDEAEDAVVEAGGTALYSDAIQLPRRSGGPTHATVRHSQRPTSEEFSKADPTYDGTDVEVRVTPARTTRRVVKKTAGLTGDEGADGGSADEFTAPSRMRGPRESFSSPMGARGGAAKFFGPDSVPLSGTGAAYNRFTHRFTDPNKEKLFFKQFFVRKSARLTRLAVLLTFIGVLAYLILEMTRSSVAQLAVRSFLVVGCALFLLWTCFPPFREPGVYSASMIIVLVLAGISKTLVIDNEGVFGQTLFQMGVLLVLRLRFLHALAVCGADLTVYIVYSALNPRSSVVLPSFLVYITFASTFAALSCYTLHCAMREDFMSESKLYLEEKRGFDMLSSMLPNHIVTQLRKPGNRNADWGGLISDAEPSVTVVFVDIVDFDNLVASTTPSSLVAVLDRLWALCDAVAERYAVTKLETVGKEYVACAGLHNERRDHATACVSMALDILKCLSLLRGRDGKQALQVRIGVHSGPVVAGIVGRNRPQFVLVGDTTNTASRMSSSGIDGRVNISPVTFGRVKSRFACAPRSVTVKSKGAMTVYTVLGRHSADEKDRRRSSLLTAWMSPQAPPSARREPHATGSREVTASLLGPAVVDAVAYVSINPTTSEAHTIETDERELTMGAAVPHAVEHAGERHVAPLPAVLEQGSPVTAFTLAAAEPGSTSASAAHASSPAKAVVLALPAPTQLDEEDEVMIDASDALVRRAYERRQMELTRIAERVARRSRDVALVWYTYRFENPSLELRWIFSVTRTTLPGLRRALFVLALFQAFRLLEVTILYNTGRYDGRPWVPDPFARPSMRELIIRLGYFAALAGYYTLTHVGWYVTAAELLPSPDSSSTAGTPGSLYVGMSELDRTRLWVRLHGHEVMLLVGGILMTFASYSSRDATLDFIFFFSVTSNSGAFSFPAATAINLLSAVVYIVIGRFTTLFDPAYTGDQGTAVTGTVLFFMAAGLVMSGLAQSAVEYYRKHRFGVAALTADEVARNAGLLHRMLPVAVATKMLTGRAQAFIADAYTGSCILFCDVAGFTKMSAEVSPGQVINMLNTMFAGFEAAAATHGCFKVQTIGDCFVCVAGIPYVDPVPPAAGARGGPSRTGGLTRKDSVPSTVALTILPSPSRGAGGGGGRLEDATQPRLPSSSSLSARSLRDPKKSFREWVSPSKASARVAPEGDSPVASSPAPEGATLAPFPSMDWLCLQPEAKAQLHSQVLNAAMMLRTAVAMLEFVRVVRHPRSGQPIGVRIGMHTGDVVGGVIGTKSFRYDCWGSAVLAANAMEAHSVTGGITISSVTKAALDVLQSGPYAIPGLSLVPAGRVLPKGTDTPLDTFLVRIEGVPFNEEEAREKQALAAQGGGEVEDEATAAPLTGRAVGVGASSDAASPPPQQQQQHGPSSASASPTARRISLPRDDTQQEEGVEGDEQVGLSLTPAPHRE